VTNRTFIAGIVTAAITTTGLFAHPDYSQDMLYVSQQVIGALFFALMANIVVAFAAGAFAYGRRIRTFFQVFFASCAFTLIVFFALSFLANLYVWPD
jgi:hypothetical protein